MECPLDTNQANAARIISIASIVLISMLCGGQPGHASPLKNTNDTVTTTQDGFLIIVLNSDVLTVRLYVPDPVDGFSRGQRFDPSSMVQSVEYAGHTIFASFMDVPSPESSLNASGFAEEFGIQSPPGYTSAEPGETFLKIGVGVLKRQDSDPYKFFDTYPVVSRPPWKTERLGPASVCFSHTISEEDGWAYHYERTVTLHPEKPIITIERTLRNEGTREISTRHYVHNMFTVDGGPVGQGYHLLTAFGLPLEPFPLPNDNGHLKRNGNRLSLLKPLDKALFWRGDVDVPRHQHRFLFEQDDSDIGIEVTGNTPIETFALHIHPKAFSAEPFTRIELAPGESFSWSSQYRLFTLDSEHPRRIWADYPIFENNGDAFVDTGKWMGLLNMTQAPWVYSRSLGSWIFLVEAQAVAAHGAWTYVLR